MPRYFFDVSDGELTSRDEDGLDLPDLACAKSEAVAALPDAARESGRARDHDWTIRSSVRNETGQVLFEARLTFQAEDFA